MKKTQIGFTLIELMIVIAILGILAAIGYPSYTQYVLRANRSDGQTALLDLSQRMERCFSEFQAYNNAACEALVAVGGGIDSPDAHYTLTIAATASTYTATATPQGAQTDDTKCDALSIDQAGVKTEAGSGTLDDCW